MITQKFVFKTLRRLNLGNDSFSKHFEG